MSIRVKATRAGRWWAIDVPEHPGVRSQSRRLDQVQEMAADALSAWLERDVSPDELEVESHASGRLEAAIARAHVARTYAEKARIEAGEATRDAIAEALREKLPLRDIGELLGLTHQRIAAIARELG